MTYLTRSEANERIISVLIDFNKWVSDHKNNFTKNNSLIINQSENRGIVRDKKFMREMLRKLDKDAIIIMYKKCGALADMHKLKSMKIMAGYDEVELKEAQVETDIINIEKRGKDTFYVGWEHKAPQALLGYANRFDEIANESGFNIHGTRFDIGNDLVLRLWKGYYGGIIGGEIGFYGYPKIITNKSLKEKLCEAIEQFFALIGKKVYKEHLMRRPPDKLLEELVDLLLYSDKLVTLEGQSLLENDEVKQMVTDLIKSSVWKNTNPLYNFLALDTIAYILMVKQLINFIVEIDKFLIELGNEETPFPDEWERSLSSNELSTVLGLTGTAIQVFSKNNGSLITEHEEYSPEYWTTSFVYNKSAAIKESFRLANAKDSIYTVNHFYFKDSDSASLFLSGIEKSIYIARDYRYNKSGSKAEVISFSKPNNTTVIIVYGK